MTTGGDWKELVRAASDGDDKAVQYLLYTIGVDPNYQHPEYMTTPLLEAIRHKQYTTAQLLLYGNESNTSTRATSIPKKYNNNNNNKPQVVLSDPTIPGDLDGQTPIELALELKDHTMVDILLQYLDNSKFNNMIRYCKTILITGGRYHADLVKYFLQLGHCVMVVIDGMDSIDKYDDNSSIKNENYAKGMNFDIIKEQNKIRNETGNKKVWICSQFSQLKDILNDARQYKMANTTTATADFGEEISSASCMFVPNVLDMWIHSLLPSAKTKSNTTTILNDYITHLPPMEYFSTSLSSIGVDNLLLEQQQQQQQTQSTPSMSCLLLLESKYPNSAILDPNVEYDLSQLFSNVNQSVITIFAMKINDATTSSSSPTWFWNQLLQYLTTIISSSTAKDETGWCKSVGRLLGVDQGKTCRTDQFFATVPTKNESGLHGHIYTTNLLNCTKIDKS